MQFTQTFLCCSLLFPSVPCPLRQTYRTVTVRSNRLTKLIDCIAMQSLKREKGVFFSITVAVHVKEKT